jgi:hypothetical protein
MPPPPNDVVFFTNLSVVISIISTFFAIIYKFCAIYVMSKRLDWHLVIHRRRRDLEASQQWKCDLEASQQ